MVAETSSRAEPGVIDALGLVPTVIGTEIVLSTVRDTHRAWSDRVYGVANRLSGNRARVPQKIHDGISGSVYSSIGWGLAATAVAMRTAGAIGVGPRLDASPEGRFVRAAVNGLIGDRFADEGSPLAIEMGVRRAGADVPLRAEELARAFAPASGRLAVFIHGLAENEDYWSRGREEQGRTYAETVQELGWTPVMLRANTGRPIGVNGVELAALLRTLVTQWPVEVEQIALVGHSMGGLIARAACAVAMDDERPWTDLVTDVVTLGSPHAGAPIAIGLGHGSRVLAHLPETSAFGKLLDHRSVGIEDLVDGLGHDVPAMPGVRYRLVGATLTRSPTHPLGRIVGDLLVQVPSSHGRSRRHPDLFPDADVVHLPGTDHFGMLNHPDVHARLREWLA